MPDVPPRPLASFTCFTPSPSRQALAESGAKLTSYHIDRVTPLRGAGVERVEPGQELWRIELPGQLAMRDAPFVGATQHLVYTDAETRRELVRVSAPESGPVAVLIPIQKSNEWWSLAQNERQAYFESSAQAGHIAIGKKYAARIYRRLYHARYLAHSEWDFLTYFEFPSEDQGAFLELLAALRDRAQNPEWVFVERELEIWMTRRQ